MSFNKYSILPDFIILPPKRDRPELFSLLKKMFFGLVFCVFSLQPMYGECSVGDENITRCLDAAFGEASELPGICFVEFVGPNVIDNFHHGLMQSQRLAQEYELSGVFFVWVVPSDRMEVVKKITSYDKQLNSVAVEWEKCVFSGPGGDQPIQQGTIVLGKNRKLLFESRDRLLAIDAKRLLVERFSYGVYLEPPNVEENEEWPWWHGADISNIELFSAVASGNIGLSDIDEGDIAVLVFPPGCSKCSISKYQDYIRDLKQYCDDSGVPFICILMSNDAFGLQVPEEINYFTYLMFGEWRGFDDSAKRLNGGAPYFVKVEKGKEVGYVSPIGGIDDILGFVNSNFGSKSN